MGGANVKCCHPHLSRQNEINKHKSMTSSELLSFEELLCEFGFPKEKRYLLNRRVEKDSHLAKIAKKIKRWRGLVPYLIAQDSEQAEQGILEDYPTYDRRRSVYTGD